MATLYELTAAAAELYALLQADEIDEQTVNDTLEGLGAADKVESYCKIIKQLQCDIEMYKGERARLAARLKTAENGVERMKAALLAFMQSTGQNKFKAGSFAVSTAKTQAVFITDESALPCRFLVEQPPTVDKVGLKEALKAGEEIGGAVLVVNTGVRIR